jgi:hypothetical protein
MNWHKDLAMASSVAVVVDLVNEYLESLPESDQLIPASLRPPSVASPADIEAWHHTLSDALAGISRPSLALQDLCVVFVRASARVAELAPAQAANAGPGAACGN